MTALDLPVPHFSAPPISRRLGEVRALREPVRLVSRAVSLAGEKTGHPKPVVVVPGLGSGDAGVAPMRAFLSHLGHDTHGWKLGTHRRNLLQTLPRFERRLEGVAARVGDRVALVGWSLGGIIAREVARDRPDLVSAVITYGSPLRGPRYTVASRMYQPHEHEIVDQYIEERSQNPIVVPVSAIFSRRDGIVDWATCIDHTTPEVENIEVSSTHLGMGLDPDVWSVVADRLGRRPQ